MLANKELRQRRRAAHAAFDQIWKNKPTRSNGYKWLSEQTKIPLKNCHIAMMDLKTCDQVIAICLASKP
jgi:hypothetical protein